ncbi:ABC transporter permease [Bifidobacterium mongoliense]|uniref:ABC transporter permease n=1 Tax=Bifidobacterium mongoliense TaxID=518643 RepID=UPI002649EEEB|nr:ABC transporter permease [Bifidobacterium mongoliense]MDN6025154.1 ABC transporter permease [Bifidobacterium mongoliense]MDN6051392.1 ABC transporter permease [Bifidobacterium mongoliense]MDN6720569.1 ABC transporter permease [Bifidobacterium mongoliense]
MSETTKVVEGDKTKDGTFDQVKRFVARNGALLGLVLLCVVLALATPAFLTGPNILNVGIQAATVAILAFGQTFVIVSAGIDLSVGSVAAVSSMLVAYTGASMGLPGWFTILVGLLAGAVFGALSGIVNAYLKLPSFIATLAMMSVARGLTLVISDGRPISTSGMVNFFGTTIVGVPVPIVMMLIMGLIAAVILNFTSAGRSMYAVGGNMEASRLSGINVHRTQIMVFLLSGVFAAVAGLVIAGRLHSAQPQAATGYEMDAIASVVIGGASLSGGKGKVSGTFIGAILLAVIRNGLNILNVSSFWQQVVIGLVIAFAVSFDTLRRKEDAH